MGSTITVTGYRDIMRMSWPSDIRRNLIPFNIVSGDTGIPIGIDGFATWNAAVFISSSSRANDRDEFHRNDDDLIVAGDIRFPFRCSITGDKLTIGLGQALTPITNRCCLACYGSSTTIRR